MAKGAYIGISNFTKRNLPAGYTQVEYIESTGTQYIDTGYKAISENYRIKCKFTITNSVAGTVLFGGGASTDIISVLLNTTTQLKFYVGSGSVSDILPTFAQNTEYEMECHASNGAFTVNLNGITYSGSYSGEINKDYSLAIFSNYGSGSASQFSSSRISTFQIYDNEMLVRDFVPCKNSNGTIGLYDLIGGSFYENAGTGSFISGIEQYSVARKIKSGYIGINTEVPVYGESTGTVNLTASNISEYFEVENGTYYFKGNGSEFTNNNKGQSGTTATSVWIAKNDMTEVSFSYSVSAKVASGFTIKVNNTIVANDISGNQNLTWSGSLLAGEKIELTYASGTSSISTLYSDYGTLSNMTFTNKVKVQIGTEFKDVARMIKKAYIGIGGIARPCWYSGPLQLAYYGTASPMVIQSNSNADKISNYAAASVGNYAIFGGGLRSGSTVIYNDVNIYDTSLTRSSATLSQKKYDLTATSIGDYALFAGGITNSDFASEPTWTVTSVVEVFNSSLTRTTATSALSRARACIAATTIGNYALFAGGATAYQSYTNVVNAYDASLTRTTPTSLQYSRAYNAATTVGNHALIGGGVDTAYNTVHVYTDTLTRETNITLSTYFRGCEATHVGNYALFGGGRSGSIDIQTSTVNAFDDALTRTTPTSLSMAKVGLAAASVGDYAIFGGGDNVSTSTNDASYDLDVYDTTLTKTNPARLSVSRRYLEAATVGNYVFFGGGHCKSDNDGDDFTVDVFKLV